MKESWKPRKLVKIRIHYVPDGTWWFWNQESWCHKLIMVSNMKRCRAGLWHQSPKRSAIWPVVVHMKLRRSWTPKKLWNQKGCQTLGPIVFQLELGRSSEILDTSVCMNGGPNYKTSCLPRHNIVNEDIDLWDTCVSTANNIENSENWKV